MAGLIKVKKRTLAPSWEFVQQDCEIRQMDLPLFFQVAPVGRDATAAARLHCRCGNQAQCRPPTKCTSLQIYSHDNNMDSKGKCAPKYLV